MWEIIKYILLAPYHLCYQALSTTPSEKKINYEHLYHEAATQIKEMTDAAETEAEVRDRYLRELEDKHASEILELKSRHNLAVQENKAAYQTALEKVTTEQTDLRSKNAGLIKEIETYVTVDQEKTTTITKLRQQLQENKELLLRSEHAKQILDDELLQKDKQLTEQSTIRDQDIKKFASNRHYLPPEEANKLKEENQQLTKNNEHLKATLQTLKKEINHLYAEDVAISQRLISYLTDSTRIKTKITALTIKQNTTMTELEETRHKLISTEAEINSYAAIKDDLHSKNYLDQTDIESLTSRLRDLGYAEDRRALLMKKLNDLSNQASIGSKKIEDQTILYAKRNDMLLKEINDWIAEKAKYYLLHDIPLQKKDGSLNSLEQYAESLKKQEADHKPSLPWNIEREKEQYTYKEFALFLEKKKYEASHKYVPDLVRINREREMQVVPPKTKESSDLKVNIPYQGKIYHPQPPIQEKLVEDIIRQSLNPSYKFVVRKSAVNSAGNENPIYSSKKQKQITAEDTPTTSSMTDKKQKMISYYDHNPDLD